MLEKILETIKKEYPELRVCELLDEEIPNWLDEGWEEDFDEPYDAYCEYGNGEAEDAVRHTLINIYGNNLSQTQQFALEEYLREEYEILDK